MAPESFSFDEPITGFRLGYASLTEDQIKNGLLALSKYL
jgi:GntR family transcriptional regulator/MocR family aminotransferase